jgi:hypothetical protein
VKIPDELPVYVTCGDGEPIKVGTVRVYVRASGIDAYAQVSPRRAQQSMAQMLLMFSVLMWWGPVVEWFRGKLRRGKR